MADVTAPVMEVVMIPLAHLHRAEWNANRVDELTLVKIRNSLAQFGVVENLVVRPHPEMDAGEYEVLSGNHRRDLYAESGMAEAPCVVVELDDARARLLAQTLNRTRGTDDPLAYRLLVENVLSSLPRSEVLDLLPETQQTLDRLIGPPGDAAHNVDDFHVWGVVLELDDEAAQIAMIERMEQEGVKCRALMS